MRTSMSQLGKKAARSQAGNYRALAGARRSDIPFDEMVEARLPLRDKLVATGGHQARPPHPPCAPPHATRVLTSRGGRDAARVSGVVRRPVGPFTSSLEPRPPAGPPPGRAALVGRRGVLVPCAYAPRTRGINRLGAFVRRASQHPRATSSAIWIAFNAAPLRRLSLARKSARPFSRADRADAADEDVVAAGCVLRRRELGQLHDAHARRVGEDLGRASSAESGSSNSAQTASDGRP